MELLTSKLNLLSKRKDREGPKNTLKSSVEESNIKNPCKKKKNQRVNYEPADLDTIFSPETFPTLYILTMNKEGSMREMCPFVFEENLSYILGGKPLSIDRSGEERFLIKVRNKKQSEKMANVKSIFERARVFQCDEGNNLRLH